MYPAIKKKIVIVPGYGASGVYDLNVGAFHRLSHEAGEFLSQGLNGQTHFNEYDEELQSFIQEAREMGLVEILEQPSPREATRLEEVLRSTRKIRFAWIEVSSICNQKCLHCFLGEDLNRYKHVPLGKIKEYIDTLVSEGTRQIVLSGGEPTLHPNIIEILDYAGKTNANLSLLSNGSSVKSREVLEAILRNDVVVKMPILGWRDSHEKMAGLRGSFKKVISSIIAYAKAGVRLQLGTTVTSVNANDVKQIARFANFMGLPLEVSPIYKIGFAKNNSDVLFQHSMRELIESCRVSLKARAPRYPQKIKARETITQHPTDYESVDLREFLTDTHECGQKIIAVLSSGEVTPCLMIRNKNTSMGNAQSSSLKEVLRGPTREDFNNRMKLSGVVDCRGCEARYVCKAGGCPATALAFKGTIHAKNPLYSNCYYVNSETVQELETLNA